MDFDTIMSKYYSPKILIGKPMIEDIVKTMIGNNKKVLIFGLGYDSNLYYFANNKKNIWFVETNDEYIKLCKEIDKKCVIKHDFSNITVKSSMTLSDEQIEKYPIPYILLKNAPYDIILVDAPVGSSDNAPGRLLPMYWTKECLSHSGTIVYADDTERKLENYCIKKYFSNYKILMKNTANAETIKFSIV